MITKTIYENYFGVGTAPDNLERLEYLALQEIKKLITSEVPIATDGKYADFTKALMEQIKFFDENEDLISTSGKGYSLGKFSEGNENSQANHNRISPMAYAILLNIGLLYVGLC